MSKIAEKKALVKYPRQCDYIERRVYKEGYDQAFQDFLEKACEWLSKNARNYYSAYATSDKLIEDFKNYMENESED